MANSNENTQNPKENQEKTADKGIQEHSEHTAENKQPESKDNAQKKDESTCLCKFFKKIAEWICARKNKNSKKANENATENNDAAKQAEMKQAETVEQQNEQKSSTGFLENIIKLLSILAILVTFTGGFFIYSYLDTIGQLSIFPDVITNSPALIATAVVYIFVLLFFSIQFFLSFLFGLVISEKKLLESKLFIIFIIFIPILLGVLFIADCITMSSYLNNKKIILCFLMIFIFLFYIIYFQLGKNKLYKELENNILIMFYIIPAIVITICLILDNYFFYLDSNRFVRFAETHKNSSWYLLHNNFQQNNGSQEANGIDKNDLLKLKQKFKCSILSEKEKAEKGITCSPETRNNALFGYMAWNLGDTKVFCPPTVDNTKGNKEEKEKLGKECIVISGKALQIMPESYISTNTDGIDDGNPKNTGHDEPAIDINTDVKFKNDLNAQSNAGLNNYNIQPVLPIQSNAKNMSIQINYGSCNHDSPRNKDGHPDIGYTGKKICQ